MPDLDSDLRDLLTDDNLHLPVRPDAVRIVHDGVRRRRRRRAVAVSGALVATAAAAVTAAIVVPATVTAGGSDRTTPVQPEPRFDVAWVDQPAPATWSPKAREHKPPPMDAPRCLANQLRAEDPIDNSGGGIRFTTIKLRNTSTSPCLLIGTPLRVAAQAPGQPDVVATRGLSLGSGGVGGDLQPGKLGYLTIQTSRDCASTDTYSSLSITLPSGTSMSIPITLDATCGVKTGGLGVEEPPPTTPADPRARLRPTIEAPATATAGQAVAFVVTLTNPTDSAISLSHCPGYVSTLGPSKEVLGLNCARVHAIGPGQSVRYEMRLGVLADEPVGTQRLTWVLLLSGKPTLASAVVEVVSPSTGGVSEPRG